MFVIFDYGVDGIGLWALATEWSAASGATRADIQLMADTAIAVLNGTFRAEILVFYGLTFLIASLAGALDGRYPVWCGGAAAITGGSVLLNGLLTFLQQTLPRQDFLVFVLIVSLESLWLPILGVLMWWQTRHVAVPEVAKH